MQSASKVSTIKGSNGVNADPRGRAV